MAKNITDTVTPISTEFNIKSKVIIFNHIQQIQNI